MIVGKRSEHKNGERPDGQELPLVETLSSLLKELPNVCGAQTSRPPETNRGPDTLGRGLGPTGGLPLRANPDLALAVIGLQHREELSRPLFQLLDV
jgi:hypothetical protein